ncbi:hypothetical protein [Flavilitoribacter nigricans]|uniref:Uncharacterized protein n=1 Tax=Flavilitoribacter nigricans (strain ATCC 23147 / DSM 23189 / NBRC 102662 / NCIMB 1420 / SS-2) TaxID=1122177 RepID=A0A2D0NIZ4_FLAN2|nr:hypothetical protein [Flavilitoribacter nigricans]PHN08417.1 hypothetical protein CRP01_00455 [Flavilitoribacter nigricans DSM 23189 = NBRC 102662]
MKTDTLKPQLAHLVGHLKAPGKQKIDKLHQALADQLVHQELSDMLARPLSFETADAFSHPAVPRRLKDRLEKVLKKTEKKSKSKDPEPEYRVFRRETPLVTDLGRGGSPAWARGAVPHHSLGPYLGTDGRQFWFDFYPVVKIISIYAPNNPDPILLFPVKEDKLSSTLSNPSRGRQLFDLESGSFYILGRLFNPNVPAAQYAGLQIKGGKVALKGKLTNNHGKLILQNGASLEFQLQLDDKGRTKSKTKKKTGSDFLNADLSLPDNFVFTVTPQSLTINKLGNARWKLYGEENKFSWDKSQSPSYHTTLSQVLIPMQTAKGEFNVKESLSPFCQLQGSGPISQVAWALPVSAIDTQKPTAATGNGGILLQAKSGLQANWRNLQAGPVALAAPSVFLNHQQLAINDLAAGNIYAHQLYQLWPEEDGQEYSTLHLQYTDAFAWWYVANAEQELMGVAADAELRGDRPVEVDGQPLAVRTKASLVLFGYNDEEQTIAVYDDNILFDNYLPNDPSTLPEPMGIAIRNALFTTTPVNGFFLFGKIDPDEAIITEGNSLLSMGLYHYLPTLPHPYAANLGVIERQLPPIDDRAYLAGTNNYRTQVTQLLIAQVKWAPDDTQESGSSVETNFLLAPLPSGGFKLPDPDSVTRPVSDNVVSPARNTYTSFANNFSGETGGPATHAAAAPRESNEGQWDDYFDVLTNETFALLDVSTQADLMGVSFNYIGEETHLFMTTYDVAEDGENAAILQIKGLDLSTQARFARAFTVPQISWEPLINLTQPAIAGDPVGGWNLYPNDGGPTRFGTTGSEMVPLEPVPVVEHLVHSFHDENKPNSATWALFALPFGMKAFAMLQRSNGQIKKDTDLQLLQPLFPNDLRGGLQLQALSGQPPNEGEDNVFRGATFQLNNVLTAAGQETFAYTLGALVSEIFNREFMLDPFPGIRDRGVPLKRIDFSGYGASTMSDWRNSNAMIAQTSQARFNVFKGRTAHEVIQVRSLIYPWGIRVVRTITIFRVSTGFVYRFDSGWQAESDGLFDFSYRVPIEDGNPNVQNVVEARESPYEIHPGVVRGLYKVREIIDTDDILPYEPIWNKSQNGAHPLDRTFINEDKAEEAVTSPMSVEVKLAPVYFDADVEIDGLVQGGTNGRVPSKKILGFVQVAPAAQPLSPALFQGLLNYQLGAIGGNLDCTIAMAETQQLMRINRFEMSPSVKAGNNPADPIFAALARGSVILPKDGSWSMVQQAESNGEVSPLPDASSLPVIRIGKMVKTQKQDSEGNTYFEMALPPANTNEKWRLANAIDLLRPPQTDTVNFGFLQNTGTQKALFRVPAFQRGVSSLISEVPDFADGYRLINSTGIFPNIQDAIPMPLNGSVVDILEEGFQMIQGNIPKEIEIPLPAEPLVLVDEQPYLKIYIEYKDDSSNGKLNFGLDALSQDTGKKWLSKMDNIRMVVDLGPIERMLIVSGKFDSEKGAEPGFINPVIKFNETYLQPIIDLLTILSTLSKNPADPASYGDLLQKGLEIAMSNTADSWEYRMHAVKEIPVIKFPPPAVASAADPLKIEAGLRVGCYFNQPFRLTTDIEQLLPSAGAFLEFYGRLSVMCASVGAATIYATGSVNLALAADIKLGPTLSMSYGFGAEIIVGLPVAGNVSLLFMVGVDIYMDQQVLVVGAFLLFKGRAEILGGIVTIQIMIEAKGSITKNISGPDRTEMLAQVTFAIDISIAWVINISFSESWQETRQVA